MILRIDHVAIAVRDFQKAYNFFTHVLGAVPAAKAPDERLRFMWHTFSLGDLSRMELVTPTGPGSFLDGFLKNREGGVHHITLQTDDIYAAKEELEKQGVPYFGFADYGPVWKELFIHPRDAFGVLIQIAQFTDDDWLPPDNRFQGKKRFQVSPSGDGVTFTCARPGGGTFSLDLTGDEARTLRDDILAALK